MICLLFIRTFFLPFVRLVSPVSLLLLPPRHRAQNLKRKRAKSGGKKSNEDGIRASRHFELFNALLIVIRLKSDEIALLCGAGSQNLTKIHSSSSSIAAFASGLRSNFNRNLATVSQTSCPTGSRSYFESNQITVGFQSERGRNRRRDCGRILVGFWPQSDGETMMPRGEAGWRERRSLSHVRGAHFASPRIIRPKFGKMTVAATKKIK